MAMQRRCTQSSLPWRDWPDRIGIREVNHVLSNAFGKGGPELTFWTAADRMKALEAQWPMPAWLRLECAHVGGAAKGAKVGILTHPAFRGKP